MPNPQLEMRDGEHRHLPSVRDARAFCRAACAWLARGFVIDVRSLAIFRIAIATMLLVDLAERLPDLTAHYTDQGVLPRTALVAMQHNGSTAADGWSWSLHTATGTTAGEAVLFLAAACFAGALLVGYQTRLATIASWVFVVSIYYRNPMLEDAGDTILRTVLFWSMFVPLGAAASVDRVRRSDVAQPRQISTLAGAALLLQICTIYWATAAEKRSPVWLTEHTALYYTLSLDAFATPLGHRLLAWPHLLRWLTASVYWLEWIGPAIVLLPLVPRQSWIDGCAGGRSVAFRSAKVRYFRGAKGDNTVPQALGRALPRLLVVLAFWGLHLGTALTMELGALPWISMAVWTVFLPGIVWDRLGWRAAEGRTPASETAGGTPAPQGQADGTPAPHGRTAGGTPAPQGQADGTPVARRPIVGKIAGAVVAVLAFYTAAWNVNQVTGVFEGRLPPQWKAPAYLLGLEQTWRMFAPFPITEDGWYEMRGVLADGSVVNLWEPEQPLPRRKPARVAATYRNRRWRKYLLDLRAQWPPFVPNLVDWLARRWDGEYAGDAPHRQVKHIDIIFHVEQTLSPDRSSSLIVPEIVFEGDVGDNLLALPDPDN